MAIHPEVCAADAELALLGGCARFIMDDGYLVGPPAAAFAAAGRLVARLRAATGLEAQVAKFTCFSHFFPLAEYEPMRQLGARLGARHAPVAAGGLSLDGYGVLVGGVPLGDSVFEQQVLHEHCAQIESYGLTLREQLHADTHSLWALLHYCLQPTFDYWLQHLPPGVTLGFATRVDAVLADVVSTVAMLHPREWHPLVCRRLALPARRHGGGLRLRCELAPRAYVGSFVAASERFLPLPDGSGGFFSMLEPLFGARAFEEGGHRYATFTRQWTGDALRLAWVQMRAAVAGDAVEGPLDAEIAQIGADAFGGSYHLQRQLTIQVEEVAMRRLHRDVLELPLDDFVRLAWLGCDRFAQAIVPSWPTGGYACSAAEFAEVITTYLGLPAPCLRHVRGRMIHGSGRGGPQVCDAYGARLMCATLPGGGWDDHHDDVAEVVLQTVLRSGVRGERTPRGMFQDVLPPEALVRQCGRPDIVPDGLLQDVPFATRRGPAWRHTPRFLVDFKMVHLGASEYVRQRVQDRESRGGAVAGRERRVPRAYEMHAERLDETHHGVPAAEVEAGRMPPGPVLARLREYPPAVGLVFGAYGEASPAVHTLLSASVRQAAQDWRLLGSRSEAESRGLLTAMFVRDWGITAARAAARLRLSRVHYVGMPRAQVEALMRGVAPRAPARDPSSVRHGAGVARMDAAAGALVRESPGAMGG
jgi:hypothetical protein